MVLHKRKPVQYVSTPANLKEDQEIWVIEATDEIFTSYEEFLSRMDFYKKNRFICEVTGLSGLDFFQALKTEEEAANDVNESFPDHLREPVLRKVQHSTISRIDNLVDWVFDEFKHDFYPGESVIVTVDDPSQGKLHGQVREKVRFPEHKNTDGTLVRRAYFRYFVVLTDRPDAEALVDDEHIFRDRKVFSKAMLRGYLRNSLTRESWTGAPWQIKEKLALQYRIDQEIPLHLRYDAALIQRKMKLADLKERNGAITDYFSADTSMSGIDNTPKGPKAKKNAQMFDRERQERLQMFQKTFASDPTLSSFQRNGKISHAQALHYVNGDVRVKDEASEPPPPPIKYPIEDLDIPVTKNIRPTLKFLEDISTDIKTETVGDLLETWDFLNVYCEVFLLDSFTFDDFVDALRFSSDDYQCELLVELHCAILKRLVNDEKDSEGEVQISLPEDDEEEEEEEDAEERTRTPTPQPEFKRTTRRSLAKAEAQEAQAQAIVDSKIHLGAEIDQCVPGYDWKARLRKRDFANGKWVVIIVGLLNLFTAKSYMTSRCEELLAKLAPTNLPATEETAISQYAILDINDRAKVLQMLTMLSVETRAIRDYIEECSATMTQYRKDKVEWQRKRKEHLAELKALDEERRGLQPEASTPSQEIIELAKELEDTEMNDGEEENDKTINDTEGEEEVAVPTRSLRRAKDRENERKKRIDEERRRKEEAKVEKAKKPTKEARELEKVLKKIDKTKEAIKKCESEIAICDEDLRQNDCPRIRVLGKDRYWNRYYWFERNAMPYGGMPEASTAHAGYMNGCLWIQGPDPVEKEGFIDLSDGENARYVATHGCTISERKAQEEGQTSLESSLRWGFYDNPEDLDNLLGWLTEKGNRELKLRKEIQSQREQISINMENRKAYLSKDESRSQSSEPVTRVSTRTKTYVDPAGHRFMKWHNSSAVNELGHIHSEPPRTVKKGVARGVKRKSEEKDEAPSKRTRARPKVVQPVVDVSTATTTRRGTRYGK